MGKFLSLQDRELLMRTIASTEMWRRYQDRVELLKSAGLSDLLANLELEGAAPTVLLGGVIDQLQDRGHPRLGAFLGYIQSVLGDPEITIIRDVMTRNEMSGGPRDVPLSQDIVDRYLNGPEVAPNPFLLHPIAFLKHGFEIARSVLLIELPTAVGSGFLVGPNVVLTNHHVIRTREESLQARYICNYQVGIDGQFENSEVFKARSGGYFDTNPNPIHDYSLIELAGNPGLTWGMLPLRRRPLPHLGDRVAIIQHPGGRDKHIAFQDNIIVQIAPPTLQYTTATMRGSSGSPVMNEQWEALALHFQGGISKGTALNIGLLVNTLLDLFPPQSHELLG